MSNASTQLAGSVWNINNLVPDQTGLATQVLTTDGTVVSWQPGSGGGGSPGGANTNIQFNNSGTFGGSANLTWDGAKLDSTAVEITQASGSDGLVFTHNSLIRGNFSGAYPGTNPRVVIKTSSANSRTLIPIIPNGTPGVSQYTGIQVFDNTDPNNSGFTTIGIASSTSGPPSTAQAFKFTSGHNGTGVTPVFGWTFPNTVMIGDGVTSPTSQRLNGVNGNANFFFSGGFQSSGDDAVLMGINSASTATNIDFQLATRGTGSVIVANYSGTGPGQLQIAKPSGTQAPLVGTAGVDLLSTDDSTTSSIVTLNSPSNNTALVAQSGTLSTGDDNVQIQATGAATNVGLNLQTQGAGTINFIGIPVLPIYTVSTLPTGVLAGMIYVSDATGAHVTGSLCIYNGTDWIDQTTGVAVV